MSDYVYLRNSVQDGRPIRWHDTENFDITAAYRAEFPGRAPPGRAGVGSSFAACKVDLPAAGR